LVLAHTRSQSVVVALVEPQQTTIRLARVLSAIQAELVTSLPLVAVAAHLATQATCVRVRVVLAVEVDRTLRLVEPRLIRLLVMLVALLIKDRVGAAVPVQSGAMVPLAAVELGLVALAALELPTPSPERQLHTVAVAAAGEIREQRVVPVVVEPAQTTTAQIPRLVLQILVVVVVGTVQMEIALVLMAAPVS
jgi:hypothetical protein